MSEQPIQSDFTGLRIPERFGVYLRWPENGTSWIHPDDVELCQRLIPSNRIFQKMYQDRDYNLLMYGTFEFRVKPTLWLEVDVDGYLIGDRVEIRSRMGKRSPAIATIEETLFDRKQKAVEYRLSINQQRINERFYFEDIQPAFKLGEPLNARQKALIEKSRLA